MTLSQLLTVHARDIVAEFVAELQASGLPAPGVPKSLLIDHIPTFLQEMASRVGAGEQVQTTDDSATARQHGRQRWTLGYDLKALVCEYGLLRHAILQCAERSHVSLTSGEHDVLGKCLDVGVAEAVAEYVSYRDAELAQQKTNLEFLAQAGELLASSLDYRSTMSRLTRLPVPRLADFCAVHLEGSSVDEMPIVHIDAAQAELLRDIYRDSERPHDGVLAYQTVMQSGVPVLVTQADSKLFDGRAQHPQRLASLERLSPCSLLIVPLSVQQQVFGALTLGYSTSLRHYDASDLVLATDLARRAALAIDNARLYQLSQQERSRVESATRAKDEFVAMVSHELRTPLNAILGWVRLMRSGTLPEHKRDHAFEVIERNANAQNHLVADLLDISRAITGKIRIFAAQVDLCNVVDMALEDARLALDAKRIHVRTSLDREHALIRGDADRLQQVVWNLLTNAIKFTPKGGEISISLGRLDSDIELVVTDSGVGIDPAFLPHVFDSFRQSDSSASRVHGGLGIGLSITKHLVDLHGGSILAHSAGARQGSSFVVRLPVSPLLSTTVGVSQVPATQKEPSSARPPARLPGFRVLVVDDEPDARELIGFVLESCGAEVRLAASAAEALEVLGSYTPDVIISDIGMPDEDGYSLIRSIRTLDQAHKKDIPTIALTAFARNEDRTRALIAGFNLHMAKPVEPSALVRAVLELGGSAPREAAPRSGEPAS